MSWYYAKNNQQLGPINDVEFETLIQQGVVTPETVVWQEGMADWKPLREVRGGGASPLANGTCASCGKSFPPSALITLQGRAICPECKPLALQQIQEGVTPAVPAINRTGPAWEQRKSLGFFKAIWKTFTAVVSDPGKTFSTMKREGGLGKPWLFVTIVYGVAMCFTLFYEGLIVGFQFTLGASKKGSNVDMAQMIQHLSIPVICLIVLGALILIPIFTTIFWFIYSGIFHVCLKILGGANQPFETTCRVVAYACSLSILMLIPFCGSSVAGIWMLVVIIIGLSKAHDISIGKSVGAVLLPVGVCCVSYVLILIILAIAIPNFNRARNRSIQQSHHSGQTTHLMQPVSR